MKEVKGAHVPKSIDLNCDMGESHGPYSLGEDARIMPHITSASIACGFHGGDPLVMRKTVQLAKEHGVSIGAHPGYPDLMGFGRRMLHTFKGEIEAYVLYQMGALDAFVRAAGLSLSYVKPHGALYNHVAQNAEAARELIGAIRAYDPRLFLYMLSGSLCAAMAREAGVRVMGEAFPDRAYLKNGSLAPRGLQGAVIHERQTVCSRVLQLVTESTLPTLDGSTLSVEADTLCIHGDTPQAWKLAMDMKKTLLAHGMKVQAPGKLDKRSKNAAVPHTP